MKLIKEEKKAVDMKEVLQNKKFDIEMSIYEVLVLGSLFGSSNTSYRDKSIDETLQECLEAEINITKAVKDLSHRNESDLYNSITEIMTYIIKNEL